MHRFTIFYSPDAGGGAAAPAAAPASGGSVAAPVATNTPAAGTATSTQPVAGATVDAAAAADPAVAAAKASGDPAALLAALEAHFAPLTDPALGKDDATPLTRKDLAEHQRKTLAAENGRKFQSGLRDMLSKPYNIDLPGGEKLTFSLNSAEQVNSMMDTARQLAGGNFTPQQLFKMQHHDQLMVQAFEAGQRSYEKGLRTNKAVVEQPQVGSLTTPVVPTNQDNIPPHMRKIPSTRDIMAARNPQGLADLESGKHRFGQARK